MKKLLSLSAAVLAASALPIHAALVTQAEQSNDVPTSIIVKRSAQSIKSLLPPKAIMHQITGLSLTQMKTLSSSAEVWQLPEGMGKKELNALLKKLNANGNIHYAEPNRIKHMLIEPNDSRYYEQWHYYDKKGGINLPKAWDITTGANVIVGVVDTGIVQHDNLEGKILPGHNAVNDGHPSDDPTDQGGRTHYHGTHVAGTIAANSNNHHVVSGVAWDAKIVPVRVLGKDGSGTDAQVLEGIRWATGLSGDNPNPVQVVNLSLGGEGECGTAWQETIDEATAKGIVFAIAAGNESKNAKSSSPANCKGVITVAATGPTGKEAFYSNYGELIDVAAPGGDQGWFGWPKENGVLSTTSMGQYDFMQGTSMAAPHVAGVAALLLSVNPDLSSDDVKEILKSTSHGSQFGVGLIDAYAAVIKAQNFSTEKQKKIA